MVEEILVSENKARMEKIERKMEELRDIHSIMETLIALLKFHMQEDEQDE